MKIKQKYQKDSFPGLNEFGDLLAYHNWDCWPHEMRLLTLQNEIDFIYWKKKK